VKELINKEVFKLLEEKTGRKKSRIYQLINNVRKMYNFTISREVAAYLLAAEVGIDISKYLSEEELKEIRSLTSPKIVKGILAKKETRKIASPYIKGKLPVIDPFLPNNLIRDAQEMAKIYPILYLFENSVRNFIRIILSSKYGQDWWKNKIPNKIKKKVKKRMEAEKKNRWHGRRGAHEIFYTDIDDLFSIISINWEDFKKYLPSLEWIKVRINEIEMSRNIVAHHNPLTINDIRRIKVYFNDWINQMRGIKILEVK